MATPDGIIPDERVLIEIKCPYVAQHMKISQAVDSQAIKDLVKLENKSLSLGVPDHTFRLR